MTVAIGTRVRVIGPVHEGQPQFPERPVGIVDEVRPDGTVRVRLDKPTTDMSGHEVGSTIRLGAEHVEVVFDQ